MEQAPSRNAPCPCGSGKKYKRCCGQGGTSASPGVPAANRLQQAVQLFQQGNLKAAGTIIEQLLKQHPDDPALLELSAVIAAQLGNPELASARFKRQIRKQPDNALAHSNLCMTLHTLGRDEEAFLYGQQAITLDPQLADAWNNLGNIYKSGNRLQEALEHFERSLQLDQGDPHVYINAGTASQLLGDLEGARRRYLQALERDPNFAPAHNNLGAVCQKSGQPEEAEKYFQRAHELQPGNPETLTNLAALWLEQGDISRAQRCLEEVIRDYPGYTGAYINLGYLHEKRHDRDSANQCYDKALGLDPENATVHCNLAYNLFELGEQQEAIEHFIRALKSDPNSAKALAGLGKAMLRKTDIPRATEYIDRALQLAPWDVHTHLARAQLDTDQGHYENAIREWQHAIELQPGVSDGYIGLAKLLGDTNRHEDARREFRRAEQAGATSMRLYHAWSAMEEKHNQLEEADRLAGKAVAMNPAYPGLVVLRAKLARRHHDHETALELLGQVDPEDIPVREIQASYLFELGTVQDKLGNYTEAFAAYDAANQAKNTYIGRVYDQDEDARKFTDWKGVFTASNWQRLRELAGADGATRPCPVFIVGFPRSGTSLLEQILGSHREISAAGELKHIHALAGEQGREITGSNKPYPVNLLDPDAPLTADKLEAMRRFYLEAVEAQDIMDEHTRWVTDKMPHNAVHLGLIGLLFPRSPVIHISRHPLNSCLSAFFSNFRTEHRYTSSLESTALHYVQVMEMLQHYRQILDTPFLEIHYEDLVEDQERITRQVLEFIGAPWDDACLQHHKSRRLVKTASYEQVTRKIYRSSLHRYRNYREAVQPVIPILEPVMTRYGYTTD